jgi:hypothetical protein
MELWLDAFSEVRDRLAALPRDKQIVLASVYLARSLQRFGDRLTPAYRSALESVCRAVVTAQLGRIGLDDVGAAGGRLRALYVVSEPAVADDRFGAVGIRLAEQVAHGRDLADLTDQIPLQMYTSLEDELGFWTDHPVGEDEVRALEEAAPECRAMIDEQLAMLERVERESPESVLEDLLATLTAGKGA